MNTLATELRVTPDFAVTLSRGARSNWKDFIEVMPNGLVKQIHAFKGLKIYRLPNGSLVADVAQSVIGVGAAKRVKLAGRLSGEQALVTKVVRLTSKAKDFPRPIAPDRQAEAARLDALFTQCINRELEARRISTGVPNVADIMIIQYYNSRGGCKTRHLMLFYPTTLTRAVIQENRTLVLSYCSGVLTALQGIHERGFVHCDIKDANILTNGVSGYLSDFGLFRRAGANIGVSGTPPYMAPELIFGQIPCNPAIDMFSFGMVLFSSIHVDRYRRWKLDVLPIISRAESIRVRLRNERAAREGERAEAARRRGLAVPLAERAAECGRIKRQLDLALVRWREAYQKLHGALLVELRRRGDLLHAILCSLLDLNPQKRPSAARAKAALDMCSN